MLPPSKRWKSNPVSWAPKKNTYKFTFEEKAGALQRLNSPFCTSFFKGGRTVVLDCTFFDYIGCHRVNDEAPSVQLAP